MNPITASIALTPAYTSQTARQPATDAASQITPALVTQATTVSLGQPNITGDSQTYSRSGLMAAGQTQYVWETDARNALSNLMLTQFKSASSGARFQGLGAALLEQLAANGGRSISQSLFAQSGETAIDPATLKQQQTGLRANPLNSVTFSLTTASGAAVQLSLASNDQGLAVSAEVSGGELTAQELKGLGALADTFESAIDGLTQVPPQLKLGDLTQLDPTLFRSVQLSAKLQTADGDQLFDLRLDDSTRSLKLQGPSGELALSFDTDDVELLGSTGQREAAISSYLEQFEAARKRGKGDEQLMSQFKEAFVQLNRVDDSRSTTADRRLSDKDRSLLSGLSDFSASISETSRNTNPMRPLEAERFSFSVEQTSNITGLGSLSLSVEQQQQSSLTASYHQGLNPLVGLALNNDRESQYYRYYEINDQASSTTRMAYQNGKLVEASATQQASQSERVRTYVNGELTSDQRTPASVSESRNVLGLINDVFEQERIAQRERGVSILEAQLQPLRSQWQLQGSVGSIRSDRY